MFLLSKYGVHVFHIFVFGYIFSISFQIANPIPLDCIPGFTNSRSNAFIFVSSFITTQTPPTTSLFSYAKKALLLLALSDSNTSSLGIIITFEGP